jgi:hypothetical protein
MEQIQVGTIPDVSICTALLEMKARVTQKSLIREARLGREGEWLGSVSQLYTHTGLITFVETEICIDASL